jgi:hypothetical protein
MELKVKESELLRQEIERGMSGENEGISFGEWRIDQHFQIRKGGLYLLGGYPGSGKTSLADELFVLQPFDLLKKMNLLSKYRIIYWSMERPKAHKLSKWLSRRIFKEHGVLIDFKRILGWYNKVAPLTTKELDYVMLELPYIDELFETLLAGTFHTGRVNPTGIKKFVDEYAAEHGKTEKIGKFSKVYIPHDPSIVTFQIFDHIGKLKGESGKTRKQLLDDFSDDCSNDYRDLYGISSLFISQFNRSIANPMRIKNGDVEPMPEDFKETGDIYEDADIALTIFDPWRYKVPDPSGYDLTKMKDDDGKKYYRNVKLMKNNYGAEDIRFGFGYQPETGIFKLLKKRRDMTEGDYTSLTNNSMFLKD